MIYDSLECLPLHLSLTSDMASLKNYCKNLEYIAIFIPLNKDIVGAMYELLSTK